MRLAAPDYAEPIVGWRTWLVVEDAEALRLRSVVFKTIWEPRLELTAGCERMRRKIADRVRHRLPHEAPGDACECGVYAARDAELAAGYFFLNRELLRSASRPRVIGTVRLWGSVVECEHGWRAAHAYPERLFVPTHAPNRRAVDAVEISLALADYGVPIHVIDDESGTRLAGALAHAYPRRRR